MEPKIFFIPNETHKDWIKFHASLFIRIIETPYVPPDYFSIPQFYLPTLKENGFIYLAAVKDKVWLTTQAKYYDKNLPLFHISFLNIIENYLKIEIEKYILSTISAAMPRIKLMPEIKNFSNENSIVKQNLNKKLGKSKGIAIAEKYFKLKIGPCIVCLQNYTENMLIMTCCSNPIHKNCFGEEKARKCEFCGKYGETSKIIFDIDNIFMKKDDYDEKIKLLNSKKDNREKEHLAELAKNMSKIDQSLFEQEAIKRGFIKK